MANIGWKGEEVPSRRGVAVCILHLGLDPPVGPKWNTQIRVPIRALSRATTVSLTSQCEHRHNPASSKFVDRWIVYVKSHRRTRRTAIIYQAEKVSTGYDVINIRRNREFAGDHPG